MDEILSYEDDNMPYALEEKLKQNNNNKLNVIKVIKENLEKVKGYLEREKEKKQSSILVYILKTIVMLFFIVLILWCICLCIQSKLIEVSNTRVNIRPIKLHY